MAARASPAAAGSPSLLQLAAASVAAGAAVAVVAASGAMNTFGSGKRMETLAAFVSVIRNPVLMGGVGVVGLVVAFQSLSFNEALRAFSFAAVQGAGSAVGHSLMRGIC